MPKEQILEIVKDKPELVKEVEEVFGRAEAAGKIQEANADLTKQRDTWATAEKSLKGEVQKLTDQVKAANLPGSGVSQADLNAMKEQLQTVQGELATEKQARTKAESERVDAEVKSSIIGVATEAADPDALFVLMQARGLVGKDAEGKSFIRRLNEKGEQVTCKSSEAVADFLDKNKFLKKSSGSQGSGGQPTNTGTTGAGLLKDPASFLK